ncbi:dicer-like protein [Histoplasma capsulatum]|uniref:Dicer-like protein n=1 Tax=Ajellomyces capsulatus TaxID=5037 RepID=A0A8A1M3W0_AJECA|nr:dicer-like protein [Histoplasma capsulatum]
MPAPRADSRNGHKRRKTLTESNHVLADSKLNTGVIENGLNSTSVFKPRAYQLEMLEASLRENIIIAMDTGSGKTQVAILRIRHELETCAAHKFVWFLTPTVALAEQQHKNISQQLSAYETRLLLGSDNVNYWSTKKIWDDILLNIRIVVSTPQVLLDAMTHGFVTMPQIALLVFDEAHHCARGEAPNSLMRRFYHEQLQRTELCTVNFQEDYSLGSDILRSLYEILQAVDMEQDPWIKNLRQQKDQRSQKNLLNALEKRKTFCMAQMSKLLRQAVSIHEDLGQWAADAFISEVLKRLETKRARQPTDILDTLERKEANFVFETLSQLPIQPGKQYWDSEPDRVSGKANLLIDLLEREYTSDFTGIVFAQQRSTVTMLAHLISRHPRLKHKFVSGAFLGDSGYAGRTSTIIELHDLKTQKGSIDDLRSGKKNLLIATSVLEEGIDVSACHLVVCFDTISNLRSFIQRRGRARKERSKFVMFLNGDDNSQGKKWTKMEDVMKSMYEEDMRRLEDVWAKENVEEESDEDRRIESTGALLTFENARPHLEHFCATLQCEFTDTRPVFMFRENELGGMVTAKVLLPNVLDPKFRVIKGSKWWRTEKLAQRDAAFQAYLKLYQEGLVNDHLLPVHCMAMEHPALEYSEKSLNLVKVAGRFNPWRMIANNWETTKTFYQSLVEISPGSLLFPKMRMVLPMPLPCQITFKIYWNEKSTFKVCLKPLPSNFKPSHVKYAADTTYTILASVFAHRMLPECLDFSCLFLPDMELTGEALMEWWLSVQGKIPASDASGYDHQDIKNLGLVRRLDKKTRPWTVERYRWMKRVYENTQLEDIDSSSEAGEPEILHVEGTAWPKRTDFLHPVAHSGGLHLHHTTKKCYPASDCSIDKLPLEYSMFALLAPSIIHNVEIYLIAEELNKTILRPIAFTDLSLVITAISASVAREATNYQRIEFLGDSILKFQTTLQLTATNLIWHEGLLSRAKDTVVSNKRLSYAAIEAGLDKFILLDVFTGAKWRPPYNKDHLESEEQGVAQREMSTKTLADVVEALLAAATLDGGQRKAEKCLEIFLPEIQWMPLEDRVNALYSSVPEAYENTLTSWFQEVESLVGYVFNKKVFLVQAFTHPSNPGSKTSSYQRLEFVGDAILDHIIVHHLFNAPRALPHFDMHLMRTALANADFLAFLCIGMSTERVRGEIAECSKENTSTKLTTRKVSLWQYMRHGTSWELTAAQQQTANQYQTLQADISEALEKSHTYPWTLLSRFHPQKFFSDLIESVLGAIFIDSHGSLDACTAFLERIGLMKFLRRMLVDEDMDLMHPKQRLGQEVGTRKVRYEAEHVVDEEGGIGTLGYWTCKVFVGDECVVEANDGVSLMEVEAKAAEAALAVIRARGGVDVDADIGFAPVGVGVRDDIGDGDGDSSDDDIIVSVNVAVNEDGDGDVLLT